MPKYKIIITRKAPEFGEKTTGSVEIEVDNNLKEICEIMAKDIATREDDLIKIEIIKLKEKAK